MALAISTDVKKIRPLEGAIVESLEMGEAATVGVGRLAYLDTAGKLRLALASGDPQGAEARGRYVIVAGEKKTIDGSLEAGEQVSAVSYGPVAGYTGGVEGDEVYVGITTAGVPTQTKPTGAGEAVFVSGYMQAETIYFHAPQATAPVSGA